MFELPTKLYKLTEEGIWSNESIHLTLYRINFLKFHEISYLTNYISLGSFSPFFRSSSVPVEIRVVPLSTNTRKWIINTIIFKWRCKKCLLTGFNVESLCLLKFSFAWPLVIFFILLSPSKISMWRKRILMSWKQLIRIQMCAFVTFYHICRWNLCYHGSRVFCVD